MKDIFFEIVEKSDYLTTFKKSFLKINVKEVLFEPSGSSDPSRELKEIKKDFRHYDIYLVVEKTYKPLTEEYIKKIIKPFMTKAFKKKLCCDSVSFGILEKETYELTQKNLAEIKENSKKSIDKINIEIRKDEENLSEKHRRESIAAWQKVIENQKKIKEGYIYILSNKSLPRTYKIGFVKEDVEKRAYSLKRQTGFKTDFVIKKIWKTKNPYEVEQKIFKSLGMPRNEKGEYDDSLGKSYRTCKFINGKTFNEFVQGASLKFFCERIEKFIQH